MSRTACHPDPRRPLALALSLACHAACTGAPEVAPDWYTATGSVIDRAAFTDAAAVLSGFDIPRGGGTFGVGDRALFGLEFRDGNALHRWTMLLEVLEVPATGDAGELVYRGTFTVTPTDGDPTTVRTESKVLRLRVARHDAENDVQDSTEVLVPLDPMAHGVAKGCEIWIGWSEEDGPLAPEEVRPAVMCMFACQTLLGVIQSDAMLSDILWRVARAPSAWSVVSGLGVDVRSNLRFEKSTIVGAAPGWDADVYRFPIEITANGEPALLVTADVVEPRSPWNLGAGVLALTAKRPGRDDLRLDARLLAARRGTGG